MTEVVTQVVNSEHGPLQTHIQAGGKLPFQVAGASFTPPYNLLKKATVVGYTGVSKLRDE